MIKICGLTSTKDAIAVRDSGADFAGIVLFYPKSKRNISLDKAKEIINVLHNKVKTVAVMVNPSYIDASQAKDAGFDYLQIHGDINDRIISELNIPIFKAFNYSDMYEYTKYQNNSKIVGYVFDGAIPGSGKTFDWDKLNSIIRDNKLFILAGGLNPENISIAINHVHPDVVDVSSGVENDNGAGKDNDKIQDFIRNARSCNNHNIVDAKNN